MTKTSPNKSSARVLSRMRKASLLGATGLALIAASSAAFAADFGPVAAVQAGPSAGAGDGGAVVDLLSVPMDATAGDPAISPAMIDEIATGSDPIDVANYDDHVADPGEAAIDLRGDRGNVSLVNTGDLTGDVGISVKTGVLDQNTATVVDTSEYGYTYVRYWPIWEADGDPVMVPCWNPDGCHLIVPVSNVQKTWLTKDLNAADSNAAINIVNGGDIAFSGLYGVRAENATGDSITITNSGDITATSDTSRRVGLYANTMAGYYSRTDHDFTVIEEGEYVYNANGDLTEVIELGELERVTERVRMQNDDGSIRIENFADIDMGEVLSDYHPVFAQSEAIVAIGFGGIEIVNHGAITVGDFSRAVVTGSFGDVTITNNGSIEIGNHSRGIYAGGVFLPSYQSGDIYRGGDTTIVNTGEIRGGMTRAELEDSPNRDAFTPIKPLEAIGIFAGGLGANRDYYAGMLEAVEIAEEYIQRLKDLGLDYGHVVVPDVSHLPDLRLFTTNILNSGDIVLKDGGIGIYGTAVYGDVNAINTGTIIVGDGIGDFDANIDNNSVGITVNNFGYNPTFSDFYAKNAEGGLIRTGDNGVGMEAKSTGGSATVVNDGVIVTGDGVFGDKVIYGQTYDQMFHAKGMFVDTHGLSFGQTARARNTGDVTVGDLALGVAMIGNSIEYAPGWGLTPFRTTGELINEGRVTGGDNSTGLQAGGLNILVQNTGAVTIGDRDVSAYRQIGGANWKFGVLGRGISVESSLTGIVLNDGSVTTGDGTIGIFNGMLRESGGWASYTLQGEDGVVTTGDNSIGVQGHADLVAFLDNAGEIRVGDNSVGVDLTTGTLWHGWYDEAIVRVGSVQAMNSGVVETGDNSVGVRLTGARLGVSHTWQSRQGSYETGYYYADMTVTEDLLGASSLRNAGTIRVGSGSTAVEMTGYAPGDYVGAYLYNIGSIEAGAAGGITTAALGDPNVALKINVDNDFGSVIVNGGRIAGDILLGDGDDVLVNAEWLDDDTGAVLGTGEIVMNGSTIDFGAGDNLFIMQRGVVTLAGGDNLIAGANLQLAFAYFEARNGVADSTLTIDGHVDGDFRFGIDVGPGGAIDSMVITGDVAGGSSMGLLINPTQQMSGEVSFTPIVIGGDNDADAPELVGVTGLFADTLVDSEISFDQASGEVRVTATFGMGHMATAAAAATTMTQNWWTRSAGGFDRRTTHAPSDETGLSVWGVAFQDEAAVGPANDLQDAGFHQLLSGGQTGIVWTAPMAGGRFSVGPTFAYGTAEANLDANASSARGTAKAYGLNASFTLANGAYVDATWQSADMEVDLKTPQTATAASGLTNAQANGFAVEMGYAWKLGSGLTFEPRLEYSSVDVALDDFASSDDVYELTEIGGRSSAVLAGMSVFRTFKTNSGSITPSASLGYVNAFEGDSELTSNGVAFANDTAGAGYQAQVGVSARYKAWDIGASLGAVNTDSTQAMSANLAVRLSW